MQLVDWGTRHLFRMGKTRKQILGDLLGLLHPSALVLRRVPTQSRRNSPHITDMINRIRKEARATRTRIAQVGEREYRRFFQGLGEPTNQHIATSMAECFPEIAWKLPPARKPWHTEDWRMLLFDAVALGFAYFGITLSPDAAREMHFMAKPFQRLPRGA